MDKINFKYNTFNAFCYLVGKIGGAFGIREKRPVFIVGTGRCGTTLLVKILNSHASFSGFPGEANMLWHPKLQPFESAKLDVPPIEIDPKQFTAISISNWPDRHGQRIRDIFTGFHLITGMSKVFFVKSAMISFMLPEILNIFPDAIFIHIYRSAPPVIESYFKKNFGKDSRYKLFNEKEYRTYCAKYWNACILEIEQKKVELSLETKGQYIEISYENLCQHPKETLYNLSNKLYVRQDGFSYDISQIYSQNHKAADYRTKPEYTTILDLIYPGMKLKGYLN